MILLSHWPTSQVRHYLSVASLPSKNQIWNNHQEMSVSVSLQARYNNVLSHQDTLSYSPLPVPHALQPLWFWTADQYHCRYARHILLHRFLTDVHCTIHLLQAEQASPTKHHVQSAKEPLPVETFHIETINVPFARPVVFVPQKEG